MTLGTRICGTPYLVGVVGWWGLERGGESEGGIVVVGVRGGEG